MLVGTIYMVILAEPFSNAVRIPPCLGRLCFLLSYTLLEGGP